MYRETECENAQLLVEVNSIEVRLREKSIVSIGSFLQTSIHLPTLRYTWLSISAPSSLYKSTNRSRPSRSVEKSLTVR